MGIFLNTFETTVKWCKWSLALHVINNVNGCTVADNTWSVMRNERLKFGLRLSKSSLIFGGRALIVLLTQYISGQKVSNPKPAQSVQLFHFHLSMNQIKCNLAEASRLQSHLKVAKIFIYQHNLMSTIDNINVPHISFSSFSSGMRVKIVDRSLSSNKFWETSTTSNMWPWLRPTPKPNGSHSVQPYGHNSSMGPTTNQRWIYTVSQKSSHL